MSMKLVLLRPSERRASSVLFVWLFRKKNLLSYFSGGRWWLTWLSIAVITLMDELTSIFYAPSEAFRFIGIHAIAFIAITSLLMRFLSTRMVEIAEILEHHKIQGGGVYSFSYLVLGPDTFVHRRRVDHGRLCPDGLYLHCQRCGERTHFHCSLGHRREARHSSSAVVWGIAGLNILGIKENARFTFGIFFLVALVLLTLLASALFEASTLSWSGIGESFVVHRKPGVQRGGLWRILVHRSSGFRAVSWRIPGSSRSCRRPDS